MTQLKTTRFRKEVVFENERNVSNILGHIHVLVSMKTRKKRGKLLVPSCNSTHLDKDLFKTFN